MSSNLNQRNYQKSRHQTLNEFFEILQQEFIICELRAKIYPLEKHKEYWRGLMLKKKEKIIDIAKKNSLFSIFDDDRIKLDYDRKIIPEIGFPNFIYKDDAQRLLQEKWDIHNYYLPGTEVKVYDKDSLKMRNGVIKIVDLPSQRIIIYFDKEEKSYDLELVTRVL